jgi:hypothetical protein
VDDEVHSGLKKEDLLGGWVSEGGSRPGERAEGEVGGVYGSVGCREERHRRGREVEGTSVFQEHLGGYSQKPLAILMCTPLLCKGGC